MYFERKSYLQQLISAEGNGMIKVITGIRRCGKSFLLFDIFKKHLLGRGVKEDHILQVNLEDRRNKRLRDPDNLLEYIDRQMVDKQMYYILLDEIQLVAEFEDVLNSYLHVANAEVYVTGSNAKFLSKDVITEFRGRGWEIRVRPLSFAEYYETVYLRDVIERNHLRSSDGMRELVRILASGMGASTNVRRIANTFKSAAGMDIGPNTISRYLEHLQDAFIISEALRYDVKGRKYIGTETKYYFEDMGIRNAILDFRQIEFTHTMENVIYNELRRLGYSVDVGQVETMKRNAEGKNVRSNLEIDFVVNRHDERIYIQSAYTLPDKEKEDQEMASLRHVSDNFKKIVIVGDRYHSAYNEEGIQLTGIYDFLLHQ